MHRRECYVTADLQPLTKLVDFWIPTIENVNCRRARWVNNSQNLGDPTSVRGTIESNRIS